MNNRWFKQPYQLLNEGKIRGKQKCHRLGRLPNGSDDPGGFSCREVPGKYTVSYNAPDMVDAQAGNRISFTRRGHLIHLSQHLAVDLSGCRWPGLWLRST